MHDESPAASNRPSVGAKRMVSMKEAIKIATVKCALTCVICNGLDDGIVVVHLHVDLLEVLESLFTNWEKVN